MTDENLRLDENEESTLNQERESEEADDDLDSLFAEDDDSQEEAPISREEYNRLLKGTKKLATEIGRLKSQPKGGEKETPKKLESNQLDDFTEMFYSQIPLAELVKEDLQAVAAAKYNGSVIKAWKNEKWMQDKASSLENAKKEDEVNKTKVDKPANGIVSSKKVDIKKVKPEEVSKLTPAEKSEWVRHQASIENNAD
jgi:hypothetical protein